MMNKLNTVAFFFALLCQEVQPAETGLHDSIPIYACISVPPGESTPERYRELAEAGFTMSLSGFPNVTEALKALDAAKDTGVSIFVTCPELKTDPAATVGKLSSHPSLAGYHLSDEPSAIEFPRLAAWQKEIQALDPRHPCYVNLFPIYASKKQLGANSYAEYVEQFVKIVQPPLISFDNYPTNTDKLNPSVYTNLEIISAEARKAHKPFWGFYQSVVWDLQPPRTLAMLRLECFINLLYGAQCIQAFTYWTPGFPSYHDAPIDLKGKRTPAYDLVKTVNGEVRAWSRVFKDAQVFKVMHAGQDAPPGTQPFKSQNGLNSVDVGTGAAVISFLKKGTEDYVAILNKDFKNDLKLKLGFENLEKVREVHKVGEDTSISGNEFTIAPGDVLILHMIISTK